VWRAKGVEESLWRIKSVILLWDHEVDRSAIQLRSCFVVHASESGVDRGEVVGVDCEQYKTVFMRSLLGGREGRPRPWPPGQRKRESLTFIRMFAQVAFPSSTPGFPLTPRVNIRPTVTTSRWPKFAIVHDRYRVLFGWLLRKWLDMQRNRNMHGLGEFWSRWD
jgi:hypothetical protein